MSSDYREEETLESKLKKLINEADEVKDVTDIFVALIKQQLLNSYCEN